MRSELSKPARSDSTYPTCHFLLLTRLRQYTLCDFQRTSNQTPCSDLNLNIIALRWSDERTRCVASLLERDPALEVHDWLKDIPLLYPKISQRAAEHPVHFISTLPLEL